MSKLTVKSEGNTVAASRAKFGWWPSLRLILACGLIMAAGWGIRGSFGHSRGAMLPGAMLGLTLAACALRRDWWNRTAILGFLAMIGWGFGGTSSYGLLIGYSMGGTYTNTLYGLASLFLVGALYGGIGAGILSLGLIERRRTLESAVLPMIAIYGTWLLLEASGATAWSHALFAKVASDSLQTTWLYDVLWLPTLVALLYGAVFMLGPSKFREVGQLIVWLALGWWLATGLLVGLLGLRINPGRSDAWAGCVGVLLGLVVFLWRRNNRAGLMLTSYGALSGGLGFACGDFIQVLGRAKWGPIGSYPVLQEFGYWTVMEQFFGLCMGIGVALAALRLIRGGLVSADETCEPATGQIVTSQTGGHSSKLFNGFAVFCLLGLLSAINSRTNIAAWLKDGSLPELTMGLSSIAVLWVCRIVALMVLLYGIVRTAGGRLNCLPTTALGRAQTLCVVVIGMVLGLYLMLPGLPLPTVLMFFAAIAFGVTLVLGIPDPQSLNAAAGHQGERENVSQAATGQGSGSGAGIQANTTAADAACWRLGWRHWALWCLAPVVLLLLAQGALQMELPVKQIRFPVPLPDSGSVN